MHSWQRWQCHENHCTGSGILPGSIAWELSAIHKFRSKLHHAKKSHHPLWAKAHPKWTKAWLDETNRGRYVLPITEERDHLFILVHSLFESLHLWWYKGVHWCPWNWHRCWKIFTGFRATYAAKKHEHTTPVLLSIRFWIDFLNLTTFLQSLKWPCPQIHLRVIVLVSPPPTF